DPSPLLPGSIRLIFGLNLVLAGSKNVAPADKGHRLRVFASVAVAPSHQVTVSPGSVGQSHSQAHPEFGSPPNQSDQSFRSRFATGREHGLIGPLHELCFPRDAHCPLAGSRRLTPALSGPQPSFAAC